MGWASFERQALRKLKLLEESEQIDDLRIPPGNRLEALRGSRKGQYSIRINDPNKRSTAIMFPVGCRRCL
ncbi:type II toxin-antitoxin system RelE/ParE family toxin [Orrella daihaiensis]|uniref:type II toxin-antitoxin system RelE/ParE family toxin n=1 Tax=Orrella daihaiensis TaxID=2782176 RepID=UPI003F796923